MAGFGSAALIGSVAYLAFCAADAIAFFELADTVAVIVAVGILVTRTAREAANRVGPTLAIGAVLVVRTDRSCDLALAVDTYLVVIVAVG